MRRKEREITGKEALEEIIKACKVCRIAMQDEDGIYIVPVNFGYQYLDGTLLLYFHGAKEGKKAELLRNDNITIGFEMDCDHALIEAALPCNYGFRYASIIGKGKAGMISDVNEKALALNAIMIHQTGKSFAFNQNAINSVNIYKVIVQSYTGKQYR